MKNERGAGRKSKISEFDMQQIRLRIENGEKVSYIAKEYNLSRQALYKKLEKKDNEQIILDYLVDDDCKTRITIDVTQERCQIINYAIHLSECAFGVKTNPTWLDLQEFLEKEFWLSKGIDLNTTKKMIFSQNQSKESFSVQDIIKNKKSHLQIISGNENAEKIKFCFTKKDLLYLRTGTDGYQMKALSMDRKWFVKSQAIISGVAMDDWAVELIAYDLCKQLNIPCVKQKECTFILGENDFEAVYSPNFELDGYSFISFESLLERIGKSSREEEFIHLNAVQKLKWCAKKLSIVGNLDYEATLKYMIDLALIDCLVGNTDRHTRNFGLFFNSYEDKYEIPLIFDNGMGLFEHDSYKKKYKNFDAAMMNVYVSPYGEDPFDMFEMLVNEFDIFTRYPELRKIEYHSQWMTPFAKEYIKRMCDRCHE